MAFGEKNIVDTAPSGAAGAAADPWNERGASPPVDSEVIGRTGCMGGLNVDELFASQNIC